MRAALRRLLLSTTLLATTLASAHLQAQSPATIDALVANLTSAAGGDRLAAIDALTHRGAEAAPATVALAALLSDADAEVAGRAARALGAIGPGASAAVEPLTAQLNHASPKVRAYAAYALGMIGPAAAGSYAPLAERIVDADPQARREAVKALRRIKADRAKLIPALIGVLEKSSSTEVIPAMQAIAEAGKEAVPGLIAALAHPEARYWALQILTQIGPDAAEAVPAIVGTLTDERVEVRREAVLCLGHLGSAAKSSATPLLALTVDNDAATRAAAVWAAVMVGAPAEEARPKIEGLLNDSDPLVQVMATWANAKFSPDDVEKKKAAITKAAATLSDKNAPIRAAAARVLCDLRVGEANMPEQFAALLHCLADGDEAVAPVVAQALVEMGEPATAKLIPALQRPDLRGFALAVLVELGPKGKAAQSAVQELVADADPGIRGITLAALASIAGDDPAVVGTIAKGLNDPHFHVRASAADALAHLGPKAKSAEAALKAKAEDADPVVREAVARALVAVAAQ
jgi:HEAT repeat protein